MRVLSPLSAFAFVDCDTPPPSIDPRDTLIREWAESTPKAPPGSFLLEEYFWLEGEAPRDTSTRMVYFLNMGTACSVQAPNCDCPFTVPFQEGPVTEDQAWDLLLLAAQRNRPYALGEVEATFQRRDAEFTCLVRRGARTIAVGSGLVHTKHGGRHGLAILNPQAVFHVLPTPDTQSVPQVEPNWIWS